MKAILISTILAGASLTATPLFGQDHDGVHRAHADPDPVNTMCPIGQEPIVASAGTVEYAGKTIGLCCPGCGEEFLGWDAERKDEFVALAAAHREPGTDAAADGAGAGPVEAWSDPYPLGTCPTSGQVLGSMGDPIVREYDGREVRLCCAGCVEGFEADLAASWARVDAAITRDQLRYYPLSTCIVSGEPLAHDGEDTATSVVYGNRLVRLCCAMCEREFRADPRKFIEQLNVSAADAQRGDYPLGTCVVGGGELGAMGEPVELVVAGRLLRLCCANCEARVTDDPAKFLKAIDEAWQAAERYMPGADATTDGADHEENGH